MRADIVTTQLLFLAYFPLPDHLNIFEPFSITFLNQFMIFVIAEISEKLI